MLTLDDYLLSCGSSSGGGRVGGDSSGVGSGRVGHGSSGIGGGRVGGGGGDSGSGSGFGWLWLLFIVVNILFYYSGYIILLWYLFYFIVLNAKIDPVL